MPSRRATARKPRQQEPDPTSFHDINDFASQLEADFENLTQSFVEENLSAIWHAIHATKTADQFLAALGISENSIQALTESEFQSCREQVARDMVAAILKAPNAPKLTPEQQEQLKQRAKLPLSKVLPSPPLSSVFILPSDDVGRTATKAVRRFSGDDLQGLIGQVQNKLTEWFLSKSVGTSAPAHGIEPPEPKNHEQQMAQEESIIFKADGTLVKGGVPYRSLPSAASEVQAHPTTLLRWIKNFEGRPLQSYYFAPAHTYFISEESIQKVANRFIKWPSQEPAGPVTLGETKDKSGFIGMSEAADIAGVSKRTMWLWCSHPEKAPTTDKPRDVIKCAASDYFYIRERDAYDLKKLVPRSGLQRGRRPQLGLQP